jgi:hypothetical protein
MHWLEKSDTIIILCHCSPTRLYLVNFWTMVTNLPILGEPHKNRFQNFTCTLLASLELVTAM